MKKYNQKDILSVLVYIRHTYGLEAFAKRGRLVALISDLAPTLSDERNLIERMDKLGIIEEFALGTEANDSAKKRIVAKSIELLTKKEFIQHKIATKYSVVIADALGWSQKVTSEFCRSQNNQSGNNPPLNAPAPNQGRKRSVPTNNNTKQTSLSQTTGSNAGTGASKVTTSAPTNTTNADTSKDLGFKVVFVFALAFFAVVTIVSLNQIKTYRSFDAWGTSSYFKLLIGFLLVGVAYGLNLWDGFFIDRNEICFAIWVFVLPAIYAIMYTIIYIVYTSDLGGVVMPIILFSQYALAWGAGWITIKICSMIK